MGRFLIAVVIWSLCLARADAQDKQVKPLLDLWDAAYLQGSNAGYVHTSVQEIGKNGQKLLRSTLEFRLNVKRAGEVIQLGMDIGTVETLESKVTGIFMKQYLGKKQSLEISGAVVGNTLKLTRDGKEPLKPAPWQDGVVGLYGQQKMFKEKGLKPGDRFEFVSFEPSINLVVTQKVEAKDYEEVELFGGKMKQKLLRVETRTNKVQNVQLPPLFTWVNDDLTPVRMEMEIPGLGKVTLYRTSKQVATSKGAEANLTDIGLSQFVRLKKSIPQPYETAAAVYRISIKDDEDPASAFSRDGRQEVKSVKGNSFELHVKAGNNSAEKAVDAVGPEFSQSSYFINSKDRRVIDHAREAVGAETDPWKKALRIEKWVHSHMKSVNYEALATADHVARTLEGDCTEYAMLAAAMCRAEDVPSRTAVGLIYANVKGSPVFAFHMWTEVFVDRVWRPIDATLGKGRVGATHLKISDQSWHEERTMTPLLPVIRVLGRVSIDVLRVENRVENQRTSRPN
ncbi:MAG: transglutaminase family protein [Planctomycetes bacterium]|nr:transglutaminase family protein [Planctomycetota bacterium]